MRRAGRGCGTGLASFDRGRRLDPSALGGRDRRPGASRAGGPDRHTGASSVADPTRHTGATRATGPDRRTDTFAATGRTRHTRTTRPGGPAQHTDLPTARGRDRRTSTPTPGDRHRRTNAPATTAPVRYPGAPRPAGPDRPAHTPKAPAPARHTNTPRTPGPPRRTGTTAPGVPARRTTAPPIVGATRAHERSVGLALEYAAGRARSLLGGHRRASWLDSAAWAARARVVVGAQSAGAADHRAPGGGPGHRGGPADHVHPGRRSGALVQHRVLSGPRPDLGGARGRGAAGSAVARRRRTDRAEPGRAGRGQHPAGGRGRRPYGKRLHDRGHCGGRSGPFWSLGAHRARTPVGPELDFTRLSDDHGSKLRFTGAMAGIHAVDLVGAAFTADFTGFRLRCG